MPRNGFKVKEVPITVMIAAHSPAKCGREHRRRGRDTRGIACVRRHERECLGEQLQGGRSSPINDCNSLRRQVAGNGAKLLSYLN